MKSQRTDEDLVQVLSPTGEVGHVSDDRDALDALAARGWTCPATHRYFRRDDRTVIATKQPVIDSLLASGYVEIRPGVEPEPEEAA